MAVRFTILKGESFLQEINAATAVTQAVAAFSVALSGEKCSIKSLY
jgi:hypothetical protein